MRDGEQQILRLPLANWAKDASPRTPTLALSTFIFAASPLSE
jgi:hypothetical protein